MTDQGTPAPWMLQTERTRLREFADEDMDVLRGLFVDPEIVRYIGGKPMPDADVAKLFSFFRAHYKKHGFGPWAGPRPEGCGNCRSLWLVC
jgi:RimJ/RimL family protein N-acetyltransferase